MIPEQRQGRDVTEHDGRVFDVQPSRDNGSLDYPVRPLLTALARVDGEPETPPLRPKRRRWLRGTVLDQGREGACVGHGVTQELISTPERVKFGDAGLPDGVPTDAQEMAFWLYREAQREDEWPGESYDGTSVNAGMRIARRLGLIAGWRWAESRDDFRDSLIHVGPVVLAIPWHDGMYAAPGGVLRVSGQQVGWHCILANGWDPSYRFPDGVRREAYRLLNSWGDSWGIHGSAWIAADELWSLISDNDGEMVVPLGRTLHALPPA